MREKQSALFVGGGLVLIGAYLLARTLGVSLPGWDAVWPIVLMLAGLVSLILALYRDPRDGSGIWFGVTAILSGALFAYITLGRGTWSEMRMLWPALPAAAALGWLAEWAARPRQVSSLVMAVIAGAAALIGYSVTTGRMTQEISLEIAEWWPLILVALGIGYIGQYVLQRR